MKKWTLFCAAALLAGQAWSQEFQLGSKIADFSLTDLKGTPVNYSSLAGDVNVIMFIATQCPVSNNYNERMKDLYNSYSNRGVKFIFVNPNGTEPASEVESHARKHAFAFPVYKDENNVVADRFGAQVTPEAFVIDKTGVIRYHGYIDDSQNPERIKNQGLRKALDALLNGAAVETAQTKAFGCTIKRAKKAS
jgi:peroxiredoxin